MCYPVSRWLRVCGSIHGFGAVRLWLAWRVTVSLRVRLLFFQAEDGIRYLVRSRGLGDVYKRQMSAHACTAQLCRSASMFLPMFLTTGMAAQAASLTVSYTHLTLPTSDLV